MSDAWKSATIESFEQLPVAGSTVLLRVAARATRAPSSEDGRPKLVADDGEVVSRYAAIPAPADGEDLLRAAYAVPAAALGPETAFSLELPGFFVLPLPLPTPAGGGGSITPPPGPSERPRPEPPPASDEARGQTTMTRAQVLHLRTLTVAQAAELQALRDLATLADEDRSARAEATAEARELRARLAELEVWNGELERRLGDATTELAEARAVRPDGALRALAEAASADAHAEAEHALQRVGDDVG